MAKGLDGNFLNYGIRKEDMEVIATLAEKHKLMPEWIEEEVLKQYHAAKTNDLDVDDVTVEKIIEKALKKI